MEAFEHKQTHVTTLHINTEKATPTFKFSKESWLESTRALLTCEGEVWELGKREREREREERQKDICKKKRVNINPVYKWCISVCASFQAAIHADKLQRISFPVPEDEPGEEAPKNSNGLKKCKDNSTNIIDLSSCCLYYHIALPLSDSHQINKYWASNKEALKQFTCSTKHWRDGYDQLFKVPINRPLQWTCPPKSRYYSWLRQKKCPNQTNLLPRLILAIKKFN